MKKEGKKLLIRATQISVIQNCNARDSTHVTKVLFLRYICEKIHTHLMFCNNSENFIHVSLILFPMEILETQRVLSSMQILLFLSILELYPPPIPEPVLLFEVTDE